MENLSEILGKKEIPINTSGENTDTWLGAKPEEPVAGLQAVNDCAVCHGTKFIHPLLTSGEPDYSRLEPCGCTRKEIDNRKAARLQTLSNLGSLSKLTFDNLLPAGRNDDVISQKLFQLALDEIRKFAENPQGWIVLAGPVGSGKTHLASAVANYRISRGYPAFYISAGELLDHLRAAFSPNSDVGYDELFEQIKDSPLLFISTEYADSVHSRRIEERMYLKDRKYLYLTTPLGTQAAVSVSSTPEFVVDEVAYRAIQFFGGSLLKVKESMQEIEQIFGMSEADSQAE